MAPTAVSPPASALTGEGIFTYNEALHKCLQRGESSLANIEGDVVLPPPLGFGPTELLRSQNPGFRILDTGRAILRISVETIRQNRRYQQRVPGGKYVLRWSQDGTLLSCIFRPTKSPTPSGTGAGHKEVETKQREAAVKPPRKRTRSSRAKASPRENKAQASIRPQRSSTEFQPQPPRERAVRRRRNPRGRRTLRIEDPMRIAIHQLVETALRLLQAQQRGGGPTKKWGAWQLQGHLASKRKLSSHRCATKRGDYGFGLRVASDIMKKLRSPEFPEDFYYVTVIILLVIILRNILDTK
ncbi:uncharacterized protein LOC144470019 [Augochlora pura]